MTNQWIYGAFLVINTLKWINELWSVILPFCPFSHHIHQSSSSIVYCQSLDSSMTPLSSFNHLITPFTLTHFPFIITFFNYSSLIESILPTWSFILIHSFHPSISSSSFLLLQSDTSDPFLKSVVISHSSLIAFDHTDYSSLSIKCFFLHQPFHREI